MINGILGLMNSGKTLYMTRQLFLAYCKGKTILSNYDLNFPHQKINKDFLIWLSGKETNLKNVAFGLDELWIWLDCRKAQKNTVATYFFNQSSKDDSEIYFTAQWNQQIDKRIRMNLHKITQCSRVIIEDGNIYAIDEEQRFLSDSQQRKLYIKVANFKRVTVGMVSEMIPQEPRYIKADKIFKLYDTRQKITA